MLSEVRTVFLAIPLSVDVKDMAKISPVSGRVEDVMVSSPALRVQ